MYAGSINYYTHIDMHGFQEGINSITDKAQSGGTKIKNIIAGLGIIKIITTGINAIKNSTDDAIKRVDTLNNYPKVLKNLGFSFDDAKKSVDKLSVGLNGLPTKLDSATTSVQRLVSKNNDINKSTDYFLAMNNAILAGGASMEIQDSALEQLTQAYSKGKPELEEWKTLQMAMPGQLKQVAQAMGYVNDAELYEAFKAGTVSMDEFMDTIVKLNKDGANGLASFETQAKDATGGIATSITNLKTAVTRGVANIITSVDKGMKEAGLGGISDNIQKLTKNTNKLMTEISNKIPKVIKTVKNLSPVIATATTGMVAFNASTKISGTVKNATSFFQKLTKSSKDVSKNFEKLMSSTKGTSMSFKDLFSIMNSNKSLTVAGITTVVALLKTSKEITKANADETYKMSQSLNNYNSSMKEASVYKQEYLDKNMNEIKGYEELWNELQLIVDENGKVKEGYEKRAEFITGKLSDALGIEIGLTDNQITNYQKLKGEVASVIEQKRAQVLLEAEEKKYNEAKNSQVELEKRYTQAHKECNETLEERDNYLKKLQKQYNLTDEQMKQFAETGTYVGKNGEIVNKRLDEEYIKLQVLDGKYASAKGRYKEMGEAYKKNQRIIYNYETAMQELANGNYQAVLKMYEDTTNYQGKTRDETYGNYQASIEAHKQYLEDLKLNKNGYDQAYIDSETARVSGVVQKLEEEQAKYKTVVETGQQEVKNVWNTNLASQLSEMTGKSIEFRKTANGHIQAYVDGVKEGKTMSKKEAKAFAKDMTDEIKNVKKEAKKAGEYIPEGFNEGINSKSGTSFNVISNFGNSILSKFKASLKEHSPSKASKEDAEFFMEGFNIGLNNEKGKVFKNIDLIGDEIINRMQHAVNLETGSINAKTMLQTNASYSSSFQLNANFQGDIEMDKTKVGRIMAPEVAKTIKVGGLR